VPVESGLSLGAFTLDPDRRLLRGDLGEAQLSPISTRFLKCLADAHGRTVSRSDLIAELWAGNRFVGEQALNRVASETRRAASSAGSASLIETVQKSGYRLSGAGGSPDDVESVGTRRRIPLWSIALFVFVIVVASLSWLIDSAMGLIWLATAN
jgi:DNA-binding winged helix-turn-helix (wHTH) protein